jgi:hypothetical protein
LEAGFIIQFITGEKRFCCLTRETFPTFMLQFFKIKSESLSTFCVLCHSRAVCGDEFRHQATEKERETSSAHRKSMFAYNHESEKEKRKGKSRKKVQFLVSRERQLNESAHEQHKAYFLFIIQLFLFSDKFLCCDFLLCFSFSFGLRFLVADISWMVGELRTEYG